MTQITQSKPGQKPQYAFHTDGQEAYKKMLSITNY